MGTSSACSVVANRLKDHPHAYGDKSRLFLHIASNAGSSPRVWGQAPKIMTKSLENRIIPTRMGTSDEMMKMEYEDEDHPHAYGDKIFFFHFLILSPGSSPRVWGQDKYRAERLISAGIIPTRMGTRMLLSERTKRLKDHPHAYGDKYRRISYVSFVLGSSPRVWGQVQFQTAVSRRLRIIPTRMGTSSPW